MKQEHEIVNLGGVGHSDASYLSILWAREVPPNGGDALFANQYAAYESLSSGLKQTLSTLKTINMSSKADASKTREDRIRNSGNSTSKDAFEATHPVVCTHPETGRKTFHINVAHTSHFEGWSEGEPAPLLQYVVNLQVKPEFTCRFRW